MRLGPKVKSGPGAHCPHWKRQVGWVAFLRLIVEITSHLHGKNPEKGVVCAKKPQKNKIVHFKRQELFLNIFCWFIYYIVCLMMFL